MGPVTVNMTALYAIKHDRNNCALNHIFAANKPLLCRESRRNCSVSIRRSRDRRNCVKH